MKSENNSEVPVLKQSIGSRNKASKRSDNCAASGTMHEKERAKLILQHM